MGQIYALHLGDHDYVYVGRTVRTGKYRLRVHRNHASNGTKSAPLYTWMCTVPLWRIQVTVLEEIADDQLHVAEQRWIAILQPRLNTTAGGEIVTDAMIESNRQAQLRRYAKAPMSQETKDKLSAANKGKTHHPPVKHTAETKEKIAASKRGKPRPQHVIDALVASHKGKTMSDEQRKAISERNRGRKDSEETRRKKSAAKKLYWENRRKEKQNGGNRLGGTGRSREIDSGSGPHETMEQPRTGEPQHNHSHGTA